jgi:hypothetical protein
MPRKAANIPANETPSQRFVRLANTRVNATLTNLKTLGNLSGSNYASTPDQRKKIETVLTDAVKKAIDAMAAKDGTGMEFKL